MLAHMHKKLYMDFCNTCLRFGLAEAKDFNESKDRKVLTLLFNSHERLEIKPSKSKIFKLSEIKSQEKANIFERVDTNL